ncbi:MAG: hypothetical protein D6730_09100 [Bacteroidetes bacterium]|nr:MAG: hypothetical protein D6730_09100 [Bacteroidota bacterium]
MKMGRILAFLIWLKNTQQGIILMKKHQYIVVIFFSLLLLAATIYVLLALPVPPQAAETLEPETGPLSWLRQSWETLRLHLS